MVVVFKPGLEESLPFLFNISTKNKAGVCVLDCINVCFSGKALCYNVADGIRLHSAKEPL